MTPIQEVLYGDLRRMSHVFRYSAQPVLQQENVAEHSFWTALIGITIALEIGQPHLMRDVAVRGILHDIEETGTGDLVRSIKYFDSDTREAIRKVENVFATRLFSHFQQDGQLLQSIWQNAKDDSLAGRIVALADLLSVLAYCHRERQFGNTSLKQIEEDCRGLVVEKFRDTILWRIAEEAMSHGD